MCCTGVQRIAIAAYLEGFPFSALLRVAPYCVGGGIRVVSTMVHRIAFTVVQSGAKPCQKLGR